MNGEFTFGDNHLGMSASAGSVRRRRIREAEEAGAARSPR